MRSMLFIAVLFTSFLGAAASGKLTENDLPKVNGPHLYATMGIGKYTVNENHPVGTLVYYRVNSGEWSLFKKPLVFTDYGSYKVEAYTTCPGYAPSDIDYVNFVVDEHTGENLGYSDADDPTVIIHDGFKYKINGSTVSLPKQRDDLCSGDLVIPAYLTKNGVTYPVTKIESNACSGLCNLTSVQIPSTVTEINYYAFTSCPQLRSIDVDPDNPNYCDIDGVLFNKSKTVLLSYPNAHATEYTVPDGTIKIEYSSFFDAYDLVSVTFPSSVTNIRNSAFCGCSSLESVVLPVNLRDMGIGVFTACISLKSVTFSPEYSMIPGLTFSGCLTLESIEIPANINRIDSYAFENCSALTSVTLNEGLKKIYKDAFNWCNFLPSITIPSSVTSIEPGAFFQCKRLTDFHVNPSNTAYCDVDGVLYNKDHTTLVAYPAGKSKQSYTTLPTTQVISAYSFTSSQLVNLDISYGVTNIENYAFFNCSNMESIDIPNTVDTIGESAFSYCENLADIKLPNSIVSIGRYAFNRCKSLTSINIPTSVTSIPFKMMSDCINLKEITIPAGVTHIDYYAFEDCPLTIVNCLAETPPTMASDMCFKAITYSNGTLCVPPASIEAYRSAEGWSNFVTIQGIFAGDANGDGELNVNDVSTMINYLLSGTSDSYFSANADINGDGNVNIQDITTLINMLLSAD